MLDESFFCVQVNAWVSPEEPPTPYPPEPYPEPEPEPEPQPGPKPQGTR